jgi:serine/threonine-protein kinase HipA
MRHYDFNEINMFRYEELFETMRMLGLSYPEAQELFRRMVFNVMSRNCDDHAKNFAFVMHKSGNWNLSPAYDICHAFRPGSDWFSQHALSINGKRTNITRKDLQSVGKCMNIKNVEEIIDKVSTVISNWKTYANTVEVEDKLRDAIGATHIIL